MAGLLLSSGCAASRPPPGGRSARWPFSGLLSYVGPNLGIFRDRFFSGEGLIIDPLGHNLYAESLRSGALTLVELDHGTITTVLDLGEGALIEQAHFSPDGWSLYVIGNTIHARNMGHLPLARALLKIDLNLQMAQTPVELPISGWSRGLALEQDRGWLYSMETVGPDRTSGATLSRIDLYTNELSLRRPMGGLPAGMRRHALAFDDRNDRLFAILGGEEPSDFDPTGTPSRETVLASLRLDSLSVIERLPLRAEIDYIGVFPAPRGVLVVGRDTRPGHRQTWLTVIDTRLMKEVAWLDLPEFASDVAVSMDTAVLPVRRGFYIVDLSFLSIRAAVPLPVDWTGDVALTPDERTAAVAMEDPDRPGLPVVGLIDVEAARLDQVLR